MKTISIVIPAYNEQGCIKVAAQRISDIIEKLDYNYEIIFVDDGSYDDTFQMIKESNSINSNIKGIKLSRNMGHQAALDCGLNHAKGHAVICMDADLQHPPELIPEMINYWENGYDIVTTSKIENQEEGFLYKIFSKSFYWIFNKFSQIKLTPKGSDFRLLSRKSLQALLSMPEYHKFFRGMVHYIGFRSTTIEFNVAERFAGKRKYTFKKSLKLASDGLFSFSDFALKLPFIIGVVVLLILVIYFLFTLFGLIFLDFKFEKGWASVVTMIILSLSIQLIFMGTIGIYIGKIFFEVKHRPVFFTEDKIGSF